ncbi:phytanoyl-CoA dioxygenase family protein [Hoeflea sp. TYP-13]|uniref:phytanoyl-CoA dioxygenase family protein n=1 Tax=Hoeflea sp. TYP-13 TaxID=3230023 RepID=UPI0034C5B408
MMTSGNPAIRLDNAQLAAFEQDGFLAIEKLLDDADLAPLEAEYDALLDRVAGELYANGDIRARHEELPFGRRFCQVLADYPDLHRHFNISLPLINGPVDPETYRMHTGAAVFKTLRNGKILDLVEQLIGPEIYVSPVQQMRMKPPERQLSESNAQHSNVGATTWHQDIVALLPEADETEQVTVWVAVTEATVENGCLVSVPGSHREGPKTHCSNLALASEPQVPGKLMEGREAVPLPVKRGGVVLFHKMNVHRALPNRSNDLRWSMDLRYHPTGQASGRPAFPGFIARSRSDPSAELHDPATWAQRWDEAREAIVSGRYQGRVFEDTRWNDAAVC